MNLLSRRAMAYLAALLLGPLGVLALRLIGSPWRGRLVFVVIFTPVVIAAWLGGKRPGILSTFVLLIAYIVINPDGFDTNQQWTNFAISAGLFVATSILLTWLISAFQAARQRAEKEREVRRIAEHNIWEERERLRVTLSSIGDAVIVTNLAGNVTFMNPIAEALTGWTGESYKGRPLEQVFRIVNEQTREAVESPVSKVIREGTIVGLANHSILIARDGKEIPIDDSGAPIRGEDGILTGVVLVFRDVTEARRAIEASLNLAAIVESSDDAIISENLDGIITSWNRGAEKLYGYSAEEVIGKPTTLLVAPDRQDELHWIMERIMRGDRVEHLETLRLRKDGSSVDVSLTVSPIIKDSSKAIGVSTIARDITASKQADRHKNEFLALLAHELRNPLAPLRNGLEVIKRAPNNLQILESTRIMMERQLQQMTRLVDDLLDVSRISQGKLALRREDIPLATIVHTAVETCGPLVQQGNHELTVTLPDQALYVNADKARLSQVLSNLLGNAAKYTNRGGKIWLTAERDRNHAIIRVRDTGIGITEEMLPKIFDLFTQVDHSIEKSQSGLGVGLTIVRRLVEMHGGTVEAKSNGSGMGSEFIVRLPIILPEKYEQQDDSSDLQGHPLPSRRVLVADDNADAASSLAEILKMMGHEVQTARDGLEAVTIAGEFLPDIIFLDIGMPRLNGYEACRRIREQPNHSKQYIVALTGWGQEEDRARSSDAGFDAHLVKPLEPTTLQRLLTEIG